MKIKDLIDLLKDENSKAKIIFDYDNLELEVDEWETESTDTLVILKLVEK